jgi:hypothetical protein
MADDDGAPEVEEAKPAKAAKAPKAKKGKAAAKDKKGKGKGGKGAAAAGSEMSVANHARASAYVRRAKGWGGLISFVLAAVISSRAGVPIATLGGRALLAGAAGYLVAWGCAVAAWRAILGAEIRARIERSRNSSDTIPSKQAT